MVEYARCNRAGNRPSEADESVPIYAAVRAGQLQTGRTRTIPPQRAQFVDLCRGWFVDLLQNESYRPHSAELSHSGRGRFVCRSGAGNQSDTGRCPSFFPTCKNAPTPCREETGEGIQAAETGQKQLRSYCLFAQALHPPQCSDGL